MKRGKLGILLLTALFAAIVVLFGRNEIDMRDFPFSVIVASDGMIEELHSIKIGGERYIFFPSYAGREKAQIQINPNYQVYIDGQRISQHHPCTDFPANQELDLYFRYGEEETYETVTFLQSANVPTMYIDVKSGKMDYIHAEKGNKESGVMRLYSVDGQLENMVVVESIKGRGNSTWQWRDKKPYSLRLSTETDLLGMGLANRWILLANAFDASLLKNKIAYDLARDAGMPYSPDCQFVDLYLNGEYVGLYLLSERNEVHPERVDIPAESSFLVSWESEHRMITQEYPYVKTDRGTTVRIHQSAFPLEEVERMWKSVENAIFAEDGIDPLTGKHWEKLIDLDSWAMLFLIDEISGDYDGGSISKFFYYNENDGTGKIYAGPVWDKDDTFATGNWSVTPPNSIVASRRYGTMFHAIFEKEAFSSRVTELYQSVFLPLLKELYNSGVEEYADQISQAAKLNAKRWDLACAAEASLVVRDFLGERMAFLDAYWERKEDFCNVKFIDSYEGEVGEFAVRPGEYLPEIPQYEGYGWFIEGTDMLFDVSQPVYESAVIILNNLEEAESLVNVK